MDERGSKKKILGMAGDLFQKYGIRSISMDDIAHHLGISKKTIYQHFSDKDDIVTLAMEVHISDQRDTLVALKQQARDAVELLLRIHQQMQQNVQETTSALLFELQKYHTRAWNIIQEFKHGFMSDFVKQNLMSGIEQGYFREDIDLDIITRIRLEEVTLAHNTDVFPRSQFSHAEVSSSLLDHFVQAITTDRGKRLYKKYKDAIENNEL